MTSENTTPESRVGEALDEAACWDVLRRLEFGRLAYLIDFHLDLVPVNYAVHQGEIVFRTAEGSKLAGVLQGGEVVFEVDEVAGDEAVSVIVRAEPREMTADEARWSDQLRLRPWVSSVKEHVVALQPRQLTGRRFGIQRGWTSMMRPGG